MLTEVHAGKKLDGHAASAAVRKAEAKVRQDYQKFGERHARFAHQDESRYEHLYFGLPEDFVASFGSLD